MGGIQKAFKTKLELICAGALEKEPKDVKREMEEEMTFSFNSKPSTVKEGKPMKHISIIPHL